MALTEKEMIKIIDNKEIDNCSPEEKDQILDFAFGPLFVSSPEKGEIFQYDEFDELDEITNLDNDLHS